MMLNKSTDMFKTMYFSILNEREKIIQKGKLNQEKLNKMFALEKKAFKAFQEKKLVKLTKIKKQMKEM